jgi:transcriptional regulator with XRE-family HTH domain
MKYPMGGILMFNLKAIMKKFGITQKYMADKLLMNKQEVKGIVNSEDDEAKLKLWHDLIMVESDVDLYKKLSQFYKEFFTDDKAMEKFIRDILAFKKSNKPRRMINNIERLITLADDIETIRPGKECLKLTFIVICIETLYTLKNIKLHKVKMVVDFFNNYITVKEKELILNHVKRSFADSRFSPGMEFQKDIDLEIFARIIYEIRSCFVHEGNYYDFHFAHNKVSMMNYVIVKEKENEPREERVYDIGISYSEFRNIASPRRAR